MKAPDPHTLDRAADVAAAGTVILWGVNAETWVVIAVGAMTFVYYAVSAWVRFRNRNDYRNSLKDE